jgi:hypothetical protein
MQLGAPEDILLALPNFFDALQLGLDAVYDVLDAGHRVSPQHILHSPSISKSVKGRVLGLLHRGGILG